ncbi:hypothetical protein AKFMO35_11380 [Apilactobacillus kunkeei]
MYLTNYKLEILRPTFYISIYKRKKIPRYNTEGFFLAMLFLYRGDVSGMAIESVRVRNDILRTMFGSIKSAV